MIGSPTRTAVFAAVGATESKPDNVAVESFGIAMFRGSVFCPVPFFELLCASATRWRCADVIDASFGIAGAETLTGLFVKVALEATGVDAVETVGPGRCPRLGSDDPSSVV